MRIAQDELFWNDGGLTQRADGTWEAVLPPPRSTYQFIKDLATASYGSCEAMTLDSVDVDGGTITAAATIRLAPHAQHVDIAVQVLPITPPGDQHPTARPNAR